MVTGIAVLATNLARRGLGGRGLVPAPALGRLLVPASRRPGRPWWCRSRSAALLLLDGREAADGLHYLYGVLPVVIACSAEGARIAAGEHELEGLDFDSLPRERQRAVAAAISRRETGIMAVSALVIFGLALRAAFLSSGA